MPVIIRDDRRLALALVLGLILGISPGCGSKTPEVTAPKDKTERVQESSLAQIGDLIRLRTEEAGTPPAKEADLAKYERAYPLGCGKLKRGEIVVIYDASLQDGSSDKVIAFEKQAPESGGHVLMQDGKTIKKMTADEFKAAPKAGKG